MGDPRHVAKIEEGVVAWNAWRDMNPRLQPNLTRADLSARDLTGIDFRGVGLFKTRLHRAKLIGANLRQARLVETELDGADLSGAHVYGTSVWDVSLAGAVQKDLVITPPGQALVTVDDLDVAQFIYLLLNNQNLRRVIDTITSKVVLVLGRFSSTRKPVVDRIKAALRDRNYLPVLFDFQGPESRDLTETVSTLAHLARFVVADLTDPSCIPHELQAIVPHIDLPVATLIARGSTPYAMFDDLRKYPWLLAPETYEDATDVEARVLPRLVANAEKAASSRRSA